MAEQKRPAAGQSYKTPRIGVVNVKTGAAEAEAARGDLFKTASEAGFRVAAAMSQAAGEKFGKEAVTRDPETGDITVEELPNKFLLGGAGTAAAKKQIAASYGIKEEINLKNAVVDLTLEAKNDPEVFKELWSKYSSSKEKLISESNASFFLEDYKNLSAQYGSEGYNSLRLKNIKRANDLAETNIRTFVDNSLRGASTLISHGGINEGRELMSQTLERVKASGMLSPEAFASIERGAFSEEQQAIANYAMKAGGATAREIKRVSIEARIGFSEKTLERFPELRELSALDQETRDKISSNLSFIGGKVADEENEQEKDREAIINFASKTATPEDLDRSLRGQGLIGVEFVNAPAAQSDQTRELVKIVREQGVYPTASKKALIGIVSGRERKPEIIANAINFFDMTKQKETASGIVPTNNNLDDETYAKLQFISDYINYYGANRAAEAVDFANVTMSSQDFREKMVRIGGTQVEIKQNDSFTTAVDKLAAETLSDYTASERKRLMPFFVKQLQLQDNLSDVGSETEKYYEVISRETDYIQGATRSIYAPERFFENINLSEIIEGTEETSFFEDNYFDYYINTNIIGRSGPQNKNMIIGRDVGNVKLVPIPSQSDDKRATYQFVNVDTGLSLLDSQNNPLQFHTDMLKNEIKKVRMKQKRKVRRDELEAMAAQNRKAMDYEQTTLGRLIAQGI